MSLRQNVLLRLTPESRARVRALAVHPELRGDHVTLAHGVPAGSLDPRWMPGGLEVGDAVAFRAVGVAHDDRVQALVVEIAGSTERPSDGGRLHVTVSRAPGARSRDSNDLLATARVWPVDLRLEGVVACEETGDG